MAKIIIVGGGIGGLATALSVAEQGHYVTVFERREVFTELGAGIQLAPNAFHALDRIGVGQAVRGRSVFVSALRLMDGTTDELVAAMPLAEEYRARFGNPYAVVHRTDLYEPLLASCQRTPAIELHVNSPVSRYEQDGSSVTAVLDSGERAVGDVLIGADGIRSSVRQQLIGDGEPRLSGHTIYRSVIPMDRVPHELRWNSVTLWAGPKWHFVHYPIGSGEYLNLAATRDNNASEAVVGRPTDKAHVLSRFAGMGDDARRLLNLGEDWKSWVLCDRDPVDHWVDGRVTLLGDAAHPMLQYAAQGACMALEDAVHLGELLDCDVDVVGETEGRLKQFCDDRRERTAEAQLVSREIGTQLYHPAGRAARERNRILSVLSDHELYDKVAWLHGVREFGAEAEH